MTLVNLLKPVANGTFKTEFSLPRLNELIDEQLILFSGGQARVNLEFQVALDELKSPSAALQGRDRRRQGDLLYKPKNLRLKTDVDLAFTDQALSIRNVKYASGASTLLIDGEVENFFSLFYDAPEKMVVALNVRSPFLDAKRFLGTEIRGKGAVPVAGAPKEGATRQLWSVIDKCQMVLNMRVDKAVYEHLEATKARAQIVLAKSRVSVKNGSIETAGGKFAFDAHLAPQGDVDLFGAKVKITSCDIPRLLRSFNNFGITAFAPENITGDLSADASLSGSMTSGGDLVGGSLKGDLKYQIANGSLMDFQPLIEVGKKFFVKLLFGKRNFGHIAFGELAGDFKIKRPSGGCGLLPRQLERLEFRRHGHLLLQGGHEPGPDHPAERPGGRCQDRGQGRKREAPVQGHRPAPGGRGRQGWQGRGEDGEVQEGREDGAPESVLTMKETRSCEEIGGGAGI